MMKQAKQSATLTASFSIDRVDCAEVIWKVWKKMNGTRGCLMTWVIRTF